VPNFRRSERRAACSAFDLLSVSHAVVGALLFAILSLTAIDPACAQAVTPTDAHSTLVQDLVTGVFLLLENAMQVGDFVSVSGLSGTVENLSVRSIRLRAGDGSVHIIPFSSVTSVTNTNRGIGNAAVSVNLAYEVGDVLKQIAAEMRREPGFKRLMRGDLDLWGVDKVDGATVTVVGQIECTDSGRWPVQREFNRRMKMQFQQLGLGIT
jgi:moderate conductance mechanosensitive channel